MDWKSLNYAKSPIPVLNTSAPPSYVIMPALLSHIDFASQQSANTSALTTFNCFSSSSSSSLSSPSSPPLPMSQNVASTTSACQSSAGSHKSSRQRLNDNRFFELTGKCSKEIIYKTKRVQFIQSHDSTLINLKDMNSETYDNINQTFHFNKLQRSKQTNLLSIQNSDSDNNQPIDVESMSFQSGAELFCRQEQLFATQHDLNQLHNTHQNQVSEANYLNANEQVDDQSILNETAFDAVHKNRSSYIASEPDYCDIINGHNSNQLTTSLSLPAFQIRNRKNNFINEPDSFLNYETISNQLEQPQLELQAHSDLSEHNEYTSSCFFPNNSSALDQTASCNSAENQECMEQFMNREDRLFFCVDSLQFNALKSTTEQDACLSAKETQLEDDAAEIVTHAAEEEQEEEEEETQTLQSPASPTLFPPILFAAAEEPSSNSPVSYSISCPSDWHFNVNRMVNCFVLCKDLKLASNDPFLQEIVQTNIKFKCFICGARFTKYEELFVHKENSVTCTNTLSCEDISNNSNCAAAADANEKSESCEQLICMKVKRKRKSSTIYRNESAVRHAKSSYDENSDIDEASETPNKQQKQPTSQFNSNSAYSMTSIFNIEDDDDDNDVDDDNIAISSDDSSAESIVSAKQQPTKTTSAKLKARFRYKSQNKNKSSLVYSKSSETEELDDTSIANTSKKSFKKKADLFTSEHQLAKPRRKYIKSRVESEPALVCEKCTKTCRTKAELLVHLHKHAGNEAECWECGKKCASFSNLVSHIQLHTGEKPYTCQFCGKQFTQDAHLTRHIRLHTGERPFVCNICGKNYKDYSYYKTHLRIHRGERLYKCKYCNKEYYDASYYKKHTRLHTGEKPYMCTVCGRQFHRSDYLKLHMYSHTDERPYNCNLCGKGFKMNYNLKLHLKNHLEANSTIGDGYTSSTVSSSSSSLSNGSTLSGCDNMFNEHGQTETSDSFEQNREDLQMLMNDEEPVAILEDTSVNQQNRIFQHCQSNELVSFLINDIDELGMLREDYEECRANKPKWNLN